MMEMDGEEGDGIRLSKRFSDNNKSGEVDYRTKSGTAWSHSYLNQKPWHPLSYPNQRRKWIAEQLHAERQRRAEEVAREYAQEQEFFRQSALISKKEKEKVEMMKAVSFMYVRPPGYNAESAKAAEIADERKWQEQDDTSQEPPAEQASSSMPLESRDHPSGEKKKPRPKDVFGRPLPTEEEFEILKNAPRLETGVAARVKPFGVEVRNVKCLRCGNYGHQSGDRECPLKDAIMPNEVNRLKRDDPLTAILAHADPTEPLKWELKQQPGMSPPRGGFNPDDPNQQIVAEDIFDEYGGFLGADSIPDLLNNFSASKSKKKKKKSKQKRHSSPDSRETKIRHGNNSSSSDDSDERWSKKKGKKPKKKNHRSESSCSDVSETDKRHRKRRKHRRTCSSENSDVDLYYRSKKHKEKRRKHKYSSSSEDDTRRHRHINSRQGNSYPSPGDEHRHYRSQRSLQKHSHSYSSDDSDSAARHRSEYRHH